MPPVKKTSTKAKTKAPKKTSTKKVVAPPEPVVETPVVEAPVETPEKRASVISATCFPYDKCFKAEVIW